MSLPQLVATTGQVGSLGGVARQSDGSVIGHAGILAAAQPAQEIGARGVEGVITLQSHFKPVDARKCHFWAVPFSDRDSPVQRNYW